MIVSLFFDTSNTLVVNVNKYWSYERYPHFWRAFTDNATEQQQIDTVVNWLKDSEMDMVMTYFNQVDKNGHEYGAFSQPVKSAVRKVDGLMKNIIDQLQVDDFFSQVNLIILGDHGMVNLTQGKDQQILLEKYLNLAEDVKAVPQSGPLAGIIPKEGKLMTVYNKLKNAHPRMKVYLKKDIPKRFHYKNNRRIAPIVAMASEGYLIFPTFAHDETDVGAHGFDNELESMRPIFFGVGPDFKKNFSTGVFETVNIYPLMCHLLRIKPAPNNGSIENVRHILTEESQARIKVKSGANCLGNSILVFLATFFGLFVKMIEKF